MFSCEVINLWDLSRDNFLLYMDMIFPFLNSFGDCVLAALEDWTCGTCT